MPASRSQRRLVFNALQTAVLGARSAHAGPASVDADDTRAMQGTRTGDGGWGIGVVPAGRTANLDRQTGRFSPMTSCQSFASMTHFCFFLLFTIPFPRKLFGGIHPSCNQLASSAHPSAQPSCVLFLGSKTHYLPLEPIRPS